LLRGRVDSLENRLATLSKALGDLEKKLKGVRSGGGADNSGLVDKCVEELNTLRAEFEAHRDEANRNLDQLNAEMPTKADKKDLLDLENRIMDKLRDMIQQILNQFANKEDVMKRFAQLSKKIREIMDLLAKQGT
jgi:DNA repair exonuclease SbcCD ATPase subunit